LAGSITFIAVIERLDLGVLGRLDLAGDLFDQLLDGEGLFYLVAEGGIGHARFLHLLGDLVGRFAALRFLLVDLDRDFLVRRDGCFLLGLLEHHFLFDQGLEHLQACTGQLERREAALLPLGLLFDRTLNLFHLDGLPVYCRGGLVGVGAAGAVGGWAAAARGEKGERGQCGRGKKTLFSEHNRCGHNSFDAANPGSA
jgi:hypothetical protein